MPISMRFRIGQIYAFYRVVILRTSKKNNYVQYSQPNLTIFRAFGHREGKNVIL